MQCKVDGRKCNSNQKWNKYRCERKNPKEHHMCKKDYICNPATFSCENGTYLSIIIDDSVIMCDEIVETKKTVPTNFNKKN